MLTAKVPATESTLDLTICYPDRQWQSKERAFSCWLHFHGAHLPLDRHLFDEPDLVGVLSEVLSQPETVLETYRQNW